MTSLAQRFACLPPEERAQVSRRELAALEHEWKFWARPDQLPPGGTWRTWIVLAGRGWGKTRTGGETVRLRVEQGYQRIALVGPTAADVRDVMIEGESGILAAFPASERPRFEPSKRRVRFYTGAIATCYAAEEPERLRGPQHDFAWCDELAAWRYLEATWSNLQMGLRLGARPQAIVTTTPKPLQFLRDLVSAAQTPANEIVVTRGSTFDNAANLSPSFLDQIRAQYAGTRLGEQELNGALLDAWAGALWQASWIRRADRPGRLDRESVAIDPAISVGKDSDETGIVHAGASDRTPADLWVLDDRSGRWTTTQWVLLALGAYFGRADNRIRPVAETNRGGDLVRDAILSFDLDRLEPDGTSIIRLSSTHLRLVERRSERRREPQIIDLDVSAFRRERPRLELVHAYRSQGKEHRAEPVAALYEQGRGYHAERFADLETQMTTWDPTTTQESPDRLDALVWAAIDLGFASTRAPALPSRITSGRRRLAA